jgi:hypothetical protein
MKWFTIVKNYTKISMKVNRGPVSMVRTVFTSRPFTQTFSQRVLLDAVLRSLTYDRCRRIISHWNQNRIKIHQFLQSAIFCQR